MNVTDPLRATHSLLEEDHPLVEVGGGLLGLFVFSLSFNFVALSYRKEHKDSLRGQ